MIRMRLKRLPYALLGAVLVSMTVGAHAVPMYDTRGLKTAGMPAVKLFVQGAVTSVCGAKGALIEEEPLEVIKSSGEAKAVVGVKWNLNDCLNVRERLSEFAEFDKSINEMLIDVMGCEAVFSSGKAAKIERVPHQPRVSIRIDMKCPVRVDEEGTQSSSSAAASEGGDIEFNRGRRIP